MGLVAHCNTDRDEPRSTSHAMNVSSCLSKVDRRLNDTLLWQLLGAGIVIDHWFGYTACVSLLSETNESKETGEYYQPRDM
jgi:hypothetical protein